MSRLLLTNCDVVSHSDRYQADILIEDNLIQEIYRFDDPQREEFNKTYKGQVKDLKGLLVFPGFIDTHVHFRQPGYEIAEDFTSGSQAALRGGVTTILDMPNNVPGITTLERLEEKRELARKFAQVNYGFYIAATNTNLNEILKSEKIAGVKLFYGSTTGDILVDDQKAVEELFKNCPHKIIVHAEDEEIIQKNSQIQRNYTEASNHYKIRTKEAAIVAINKIRELSEKYNRSDHIAHLSSPEEAEIIKNSSLSGEIAIPHLFFSTDDYEHLGNLIKCNPSVKCTNEEVEKLWEYFSVIDELQVVTDHAPHPYKSKVVKNYWDAKSGIPSIENASRMLLKKVSENKLAITDVSRIYSFNPAKNFNIKGRGEIKEGNYADFAIVNPQKISAISNKTQITRCGWTPFDSIEIPYDIEMTIINGEIVYVNEKINIEEAVNCATEVFY